MSIWVTGDTHGNFYRFDKNVFYEQNDKELFPKDKSSIVIICGDFGGVWGSEDSGKEKFELDKLESKPWTTIFVDGNHENFNRLKEYPIKEWNGGKVHVIRPHVLHLIRGEVFNINGYKFFAFGGAKSHDIKDGILDINDYSSEHAFKKKYKRWKELNKSFRVKDISWWEEELPNTKEMGNGLVNLDKNNFKVDYIISHCCATSTQTLFSHGLFKNDYLNDYFEIIRQKCNFKKWFFGHYHDNRAINHKELMLYEQIIRID